MPHPHPNRLSRRQLLRSLGVLTGAAAGAVGLGACAGNTPTATPGTPTPTGTTRPTATATATAPGASPAAAAEPRRIRTCVYARNHASSPLFWQRFAPEGVTVDVGIVTSASEVQQGLESGDFDFGLMGVYNTILSLDTPEGINSRVVGMLSREGSGLIGSVERGVATVQDLAGRRIAVPPPGVQTLILTSLLGQAGLDFATDIESVPLGYADHPGALAAGDVDAYVGTEPLCTQSVADGVGQRLPEIYDSPVGDLNTALWASPSALEDPEFVVLATELQRQAAEYLTPGGTNDEAVWRDLLVGEFEYDEAIYEAVLSNLGAVWKMDEQRVAQFEGAAALMAEQGVLSEPVDVEQLFARQFWLS